MTGCQKRRFTLLPAMPTSPRFFNHQASRGFYNRQAGGGTAHGVGRQEREFSTSETPTESRQVSNGGLWSLTTPHQFHRGVKSTDTTLRGPSTTPHHAHGVGRQERENSTSKTPTESRQVSNGGLWSLMTPLPFYRGVKKYHLTLPREDRQ
jgi:hypothetical protein